MPKKSKSAQRRPFYKSPPPKPARLQSPVHSPQSAVKNPKPDARSSTGDRGHETSDFSHPHLLAPSHFTLREDGSIGTPASGTACSTASERASGILPEDPSSKSVRPVSETHGSTLPRLAFSDSARGIWLYCGNCLELLDAIAAKYPDGRFDAIFADPPYFLPAGP